MVNFIIRRLLISVPVLFLVITLVFFVFQLIPGDPARMYAGDEVTQEELEAIRKELGLDRPVMVQYFSYLGRLFRGDLGKSFSFRQPVINMIKRRFGNTVQLSLGAIALASFLGLTMGTISAVYRGRLADYFFSVLAIAGISIPSFWLGLLLMYFFSVKLGVLPSAGKETWKHYILPVFSLSVFSMAFITRMTRSALLETIGEDYVRTARAKGLEEYAVLMRHALRNALLPIIIVVGLRFGYMLGGAVITESVFAWPGMGQLFITAVGARDIPMVQGVLLVFAISFLLVNLGVDVAYAFVDPRIRYE
jgi:ABC-type dipeptide/oligopeptide/nickel transport system permease component